MSGYKRHPGGTQYLNSTMPTWGCKTRPIKGLVSPTGKVEEHMAHTASSGYLDPAKASAKIAGASIHSEMRGNVFPKYAPHLQVRDRLRPTPSPPPRPTPSRSR